MTAVLLLTLTLADLAAAPRPVLSDYTHSAWGPLQGAPVDVLKFAQGADGWLWIATATGLYRYDGVRFERTDSVFGHRLYSTNVLGLLAARDGALWVGYRLGGVTALRQGGARTYIEADGLPGGAVSHIEEGPDGTVWVAARDGVARLRPGAARFEPQGAAVGLPGKRMFQILFARDGTQWIASLSGAFFRAPGAQRFTQAWPRTTLMAMAEAPDGTIWASDAAGRYFRLHTSAPAVPPQPELDASGMGFDRAGQMWLWHPDAVERRPNVATADPSQRLTAQTGLSGALPQTFFQDREGSIWIGTSAGLDRLRPNRLRALPTPRQFDHPGMIAGPDGGVWVGDYAGDVRSFTADGAGRTVLRSHFAASHRTADGTLWVGDDQALHRRAPDGTFTTVAPPDGVRNLDPQAIVQDGRGALWVSFSGGGLFRLADGRWTRDGGLAGIPPELALTMALDADGKVWMGHARNRVSIVDGAKVRQLGAAQGLQLGNVLTLCRDGATMWAGGETGTALFRDGRFVPLHGRHGETFRGASGIVRLPDGDLWLHGADGIFRIAAASVAAWLREPARPVDFERFGAPDGLQGHASQLRPLPSMILAPGGELWFATGSAIATLDPTRIRRNPLPPPVLIRSVSANGLDYAAGNNATVALPQGSDTLQVAFTALSLAMPERVRFRYRLEGVDHGWQEPVGRREAYYTNLAPGTYRFHVTAANEDGVWNPAGATVTLRIPPKFVQTPWFVVLLALAAGLLLSGAYALRVRHLTRRLDDRLRARLAERARIARSLHDTLLQSVQGLIMSFHAHVHQLPHGSHERQRLDRALDRADRLLAEGRDQIMDLRAAAPGADLADALREFGDSLSDYGTHVFEMTVTGEGQPLQPRVNDELYAIAREALSNAARYAQADRIVLEIDYGSALTLRVHDDGRGLDDAIVQAGGRPGHFGLVGMRERAAVIGAELRMTTRPGQGMALAVVVPAAQAYA